MGFSTNFTESLVNLFPGKRSKNKEHIITESQDNCRENEILVQEIILP